MAQFMIDITLPDNPNAEFFSLIPLQRAHIDKLVEQGTITGYSLSLDRSRLWVTMNAKSRREVTEILSAFPMFNFFEPTIYPLAFHQTSLMSLLKVSMN
jgi:muconolactone delta-isomerase